MAQSPPSQLPQTTALARRVARSMWLRLWSGLFVRVVPYAMGVALLLVVGLRWWMGIEWWWGVPVDLLILVTLGTGIVAYLKRPGAVVAAGWLDETAHTQSRYRSALELAAGSNADAAFATIAVERAEQAASGMGLPTNDSKPWYEQTSVYVAGILLVLIVVAGLYMPVRQLANPLDDLPSPIAIADAREQIQNQQQELEELAEDLVEEDPLIAEALKDLAALEEELTSSESSPDPESAAAVAESRIEQLADELDERAEQQRLDEQALREQLDQLKTESLSEDSDLERFREQLSEGRYEEAIEELDAMNDAIESMSDEEREQVAEDLESMANAIEPDEQSQSEDQPESSEEPAADQPDPVDAEKLSEALKDQAEQIRDREPQPPEQEEPQEQDQSESSENDQQQPESDQNEQQEESSEQQQEQQQEGNESDTGEQRDDQQQQPAQEPSEQSDQGEQSEQGEPQEQSSDEPSESGEQNQQTESTDPSGDEQSEPQEQPESGDQPQQGEEPKQEPKPESGAEPSSEEQSPQPSDDAPEGKSTLKKMLEEAQKQAQGAEQDRTMAERLREQLEQSPDDQPQSEAFEPSPNSEDQEGTGPGDQDVQMPDGQPSELAENQEYVPVQAADEQAQADDSSTPIGKWYNPDDEQAAPVGQSDTAQRFRDAAKNARQQVDDRRVPRRYREVIRDYFKQLDQRAAKLAPSSDGADAPAPAPPEKSE